MLELRPNCEHCKRELPPDARDAMICSYECTFCNDCVERVLQNVCPNCGGGFEKRPIRPRREWLPGISLARAPASMEPVHEPVDANSHARLLKRVGSTPPEDR